MYLVRNINSLYYLGCSTYFLEINIKYYKTAYDNQIMVNNLGKNIYHSYKFSYNFSILDIKDLNLIKRKFAK